MVKAKRPGKGRKDDGKGPSLFFIIALVVGFAILLWWFFHFLPERATDEKQGRNGWVEIARADPPVTISTRLQPS